jgi:dolichol-phosphate mannosyltransferase
MNPGPGSEQTRGDPTVTRQRNEVWVILPTYNEAANVEGIVDRVHRRLSADGAQFRILVVDDASPDGTGRIADRLAAADRHVSVLHRAGKEGLARAYLAGFAFALARGADIVVQMDCDGSHDPAVITRMMRELDAGADLVVGSRYVAGGATDWTASRRLLSRIGSAYARAILRVPIHDLTGGFKAFRANVLETIELSNLYCRGFGFQIETTYRALRSGFRVTEIPIRFVDRRAGASKMSWRITFEAFKMVPRQRIRRVRMLPSADGPLRILMLTRGVVPLAAGAGGAELAAYELSRALVADGHTVTMLTDFDGGDTDEFPGLVLVPIGSRLVRWASRVPGKFPNWLARHLAGNVAVALRARQILREDHHDLVHAHGALATVMLSVLSRVPVVYTEHDAPPWLCHYRSRAERVVRRVVFRIINVSAFRRADRVGATFAALREDAVRRFRLPGAKVTTIANGTNISVFKVPAITPAENSLDAALRHGGRPVAFDEFCLFVGRLESRKAPDLLLQSLAKVPQVNCVFVGDGPMRPALEQLATELGLDSRVAFLGYVRGPDLPALYSRAQLLLLPSVSEAMPLVVLEAMACGTPVLASRIAGLPTAVRDYETGLLVDPGDVGQLALAMRFLLRDQPLLQRMSDEARRTVQQRFMWSGVAAEYVCVYRSLAGRPPPLAAHAREPRVLIPTRSALEAPTHES